MFILIIIFEDRYLYMLRTPANLDVDGDLKTNHLVTRLNRDVVITRHLSKKV